MVRTFVFNEGCVIIDNIRIPNEVATALGDLECSFTSWTALAVQAGSKLLIPYHPSYLEIACPNLDRVINGLRGLDLMVWRGRQWATVSWVHKPLRIALGELRVFEKPVSRVGRRCGLSIASIEDAIKHVRDLKLLSTYSNGVTRALINATRNNINH